MIDDFNEDVYAINEEVNIYNDRLNNREDSLEYLRGEFWRLMRWQYDQTVSRFEQDKKSANKKLKALDRQIDGINADIKSTITRLREAQRKTVNVDEAVDSINSRLIDLGIYDFWIQKYSDYLYRVVRANDSKDAFRSLSEGEKMIISFLYFCELCKGKSSADDAQGERIVVIDDPISSLSHIFVFNVGQMIRSMFFRGSQFPQVFVLTHSLYFFYELTDTNHRRRKDTQKLFRLTKPSSGSVIEKMKYEEIQNDYQAYWSVVNDSSQPPALVANCMRNIVEYFLTSCARRIWGTSFRCLNFKIINIRHFVGILTGNHIRLDKILLT